MGIHSTQRIIKKINIRICINSSCKTNTLLLTSTQINPLNKEFKKTKHHFTVLQVESHMSNIWKVHSIQRQFLKHCSLLHDTPFPQSLFGLRQEVCQNQAVEHNLQHRRCTKWVHDFAQKLCLPLELHSVSRLAERHTQFGPEVEKRILFNTLTWSCWSNYTHPFHGISSLSNFVPTKI